MKNTSHLFVLFALVMVTLLAVPASAAPKKVTVTLYANGSAASENYLSAKSKKTKFSTKLSYGAKGTTVRLQRLDKTKNSAKPTWKTVKTVKVKKNKKNLKIALGSHTTTAQGRWMWRVTVSAVKNKSKAGTSKTIGTHRLPKKCPAFTSKSKLPAEALAVAKPKSKKKADKSKQVDLIEKYICSAKKGSTIKIALWIIDSDHTYSSKPNQTTRILGALDYVYKHKKVKITIVQDAANAKQESPTTTQWLRSFSTGKKVYACKGSCLVEGSDPEQNHVKFVTISSLVNGKPTVLISSGNWSSWQLRDYQNYSVAFNGNKNLYDRFSARHDAMKLSAQGKSLASYKPKAKSDEITRRAVSNSNYQAWAGTVNEKNSGAYGVAFSPQQVGQDNMLDRLKTLTCEGVSGGQVRMAMYYSWWPILPEYATEFKRLKEEGCDVRIIVGDSLKAGKHTYETSADGRKRYDDASSQKTVCVERLHTKFLTVKARDAKTNKVEHTVWVGSRNLDDRGLENTDEVSVRVTRATNTGLYKSINTHWNDLYKQKESKCSPVS